jgi:hypothetical protein
MSMASAIDWLANRIEASGEFGPEAYPPPCPPGPLPIAGWWAREMQEPRQEMNASDYHNRLWFTLQLFRRMPTAERDILTAGIREDEIPWRGESLDRYLGIHAQATLARDLGLACYIREHAPAEVRSMFAATTHHR